MHTIILQKCPFIMNLWVYIRKGIVGLCIIDRV